MMNRETLQVLLEQILGSRNVYFQPPTNIQMKYPAIVYSREKIENTYADNSVYKQDMVYRITFIDKNPDNKIVYKLSQLPLCRYDRHYVSDNLNHDVFTLYY